MFFKFLLKFVIFTLVIYYLTLVLQMLGILRLKEDPIFKFNWKYLIPFYQYFKIFK